MFQREALAWGHRTGLGRRASFIHLGDGRVGAALTKNFSRSHSLEIARDPLLRAPCGDGTLMMGLCVCAISDHLCVPRNLHTIADGVGTR